MRPRRACWPACGPCWPRRKCAASDVALVVHGTTLATNALIERKGARTALLTTEGFRDSLEIAWEHRFEQYDIYMERPDAAGAARPALRRAGARRRRRRRAAAARRGGGAPLSRGARGARRSRRSPSASCTASPTTAHERRAGRDPRRGAAGRGDLALVRGLSRDPRVRARLDHHRQRLCAAAHGGLSRPARGRPAQGRHRRPAAADDVVGRHHHGRDGAALSVRLVESGPAGGAILALSGRGARTASTRRCRLRHGRHDGQALP